MTQELVTFWSGGKRAGRYELAWSGAAFAFKTLETNVYFGGKPLRLGTQTNVVTDRLGSVRREAKDFFPYGQERTVTAGETEKYATYMHDGRTDLAYADQRYYATGAGRFMTADPAGSGLNWYAYVGGDPVNYADPSGLAGCRPAREGWQVSDAIRGSCPPGYWWNAIGDRAQFINAASPGTSEDEPPGLAWASYFLTNAPDGDRLEANTCLPLFNIGPSAYTGFSVGADGVSSTGGGLTHALHCTRCCRAMGRGPMEKWVRSKVCQGTSPLRKSVPLSWPTTLEVLLIPASAHI